MQQRIYLRPGSAEDYRPKIMEGSLWFVTVCMSGDELNKRPSPGVPLDPSLKRRSQRSVTRNPAAVTKGLRPRHRNRCLNGQRKSGELSPARTQHKERRRQVKDIYQRRRAKLCLISSIKPLVPKNEKTPKPESNSPLNPRK